MKKAMLLFMSVCLLASGALAVPLHVGYKFTAGDVITLGDGTVVRVTGLADQADQYMQTQRDTLEEMQTLADSWWPLYLSGPDWIQATSMDSVVAGNGFFAGVTTVQNYFVEVVSEEPTRSKLTGEQMLSEFGMFKSNTAIENIQQLLRDEGNRLMQGMTVIIGCLLAVVFAVTWKG